MGMAGSGGGRGRGPGRGRGARAPMAEINVTPFVDVMLVLLIIFMVTAPLLATGVPIDLPEARATPLDQEPEQIAISIDRDGVVYIGEAQVAPGNVGLALDSLASGLGAKKPVVTLRADRALRWDQVMAVLGELNRSGFTAISLVSNSSARAL